MTTRVRNDLFDPAAGYDRGRPAWFEGVWYLIKCSFFLTPLPWPSSFKCFLLRLFGAQIGIGVCLKPRINIHLPWKLSIGDFAWIGEEVNLLSLETIYIGAHCCISQRAFLCTGNHDFRVPTMAQRHRPIRIAEGAWIGAQVFVGPGITVGAETVVTAASVVTKDLPSGMICSGNPCRPLKPRWREQPS